MPDKNELNKVLIPKIERLLLMLDTTAFQLAGELMTPPTFHWSHYIELH